MTRIKIFLTVGTHPAPFDRLIHAIDKLAQKYPKKYDIIAQIGTSYPPKYIRNWFRSCGFNEFRGYINWSNIVISHTGAGTLITTLSHKKPIILVPRLGNLGEHTNNHQLELAGKFKHINGVEVIYDPENIDMEKLDKRIHKLLKTFKPFKSKEKEKLERNLLRWLKEQEGDI